MKSVPLSFKAPMVRALLAGTKTQTRRVMADQPKTAPTVWKAGLNRSMSRVAMAASWEEGGDLYSCLCPYGVPGDRLWVRETWAPDPPIDDSWASSGWSGCGRRIDGVPERFRHPHFCIYAADWLHGPVTWRPSIHMPRWASRITLELSTVRVERLQDISEADAIAEGVSHEPRCLPDDDAAAFHRIGPVAGDSFPIARYAALWDSINGPCSWEENPWVWVIAFRRISGSTGESA